MVLANFNPFVALRMNTPAVFTWMSQNKLYACLMVFFLSNTIEGQLISTGAFEIIFNDVPKYKSIFITFIIYIQCTSLYCRFPVNQKLHFSDFYEVSCIKQNLHVRNGCDFS
ncbi:thioredoxin reductase-like selenoprotein T1b [Nephila pilipes]|uniref:Thioredoxin reductase-like selenoprotein T1b n=1 Tax=Nephila pilipes TaxID=299642 RepID=A0A8X6PDK3_NEPPI|nr:thioredoxin reductase-like selenoprotein T1b [Nephila pilipes]